MNVFDYLFENTQTLSKDFVLGNSESVSFKQLHHDALILAGKLRKDFGTAKNVIILSENSVFFITAYLAILKSDNVCVPLNPILEEKTLTDIISRTDPIVAFASIRFEKRLTECSFPVINHEITDSWMQNSTVSEIEFPETNQGEISEIIFTSGSTGLQKGVMISHKNIISNTNSILEYLELTKDDIIEVVMPFYYCYGLSLLHTHLRIGGSIVLNNLFICIGSVIKDLNEYNCTGFSGVPSHFQIMLRKTKAFKTTKFPSLRYFTQAGGKLHTAFVQEFMDAFPDKKFFVMYGQTEATARLSYMPSDQLSYRLGSIGKGIPGVCLRVVNTFGQDVKPGESGEIIAKGDNIMLGYYRDEETTAQTIKEGWLHTGDLATIDEDGFIYIQGRMKEIIKVLGFRISPKEIEEVIVSFPGVIDCTIKGEQDDVCGEVIKAIIYIHPAQKEKFTEQIIQKYCSERLASYKIPKKIEFSTQFEFNEAGKKVIKNS